MKGYPEELLDCADRDFAAKESADPDCSMDCQFCGNKNAERYRQRTSYVKEERNWVTLCPECRADNNQHWDDMWADYYAGCM
jgi:hypothetical protein